MLKAKYTNMEYAYSKLRWVRGYKSYEKGTSNVLEGGQASFFELIEVFGTSPYGSQYFRDFVKSCEITRFQDDKRCYHCFTINRE